MRSRHEKVFGTAAGTIVAAAGALLIALSASGLVVQKRGLLLPAASQSERSIADGREAFEGRCAGCHGIDGHGGERAPDIATSTKTQQRTDAALAQIINNGIPSAGMPAFSTLDEFTSRALVRYLRFLQGQTGSASLPGNPDKGKAVFFGSARCSQCHLAAGQGGFIASDLSSYARSRPVEEIRGAIVKPAQISNVAGGAIVIVTRAGQTLSGVLRNEDNFSMQLQALDGSFHLLMKSDIASVQRSTNSLMPTNFGSTLSAGELNDLISFLMNMAQQDKSPQPKKTPSTEEEE